MNAGLAIPGGSLRAVLSAPGHGAPGGDGGALRGGAGEGAGLELRVGRERPETFALPGCVERLPFDVAGVRSLLGAFSGFGVHLLK